MKKIVICLLLCLPAYAKPKPEMHTAKVISQDVDAYDGGTAVMPIGRGIMGVPIMRRSNIVVIETAKGRLTWSEVGRKTIILPVNGTVQFYLDGNLFVVLDSQNKKHKFALMHFESIVPKP